MKKKLISAVGLLLVGNLGFSQLVKVDGKSVSFETPDLKTELNLNGTELEGKKVQWNIEDPYIVSLEEDETFTSLSGGTTKVTASADGNSVDFFLTVEEPNRLPTKDVIDPKTISENIEIIMCGDSIMREYKENEVDQCGLGQTIGYFFDNSKVNVDNSISNGGRSTRYFWNEPSRWNVVKEKLKANKENGKTTLVFFSFGHNDQRTLTGKDSRVGPYGLSFTFAEQNQNGTVAGTHYDYIERYIVETRELGAIPIMVSPFVRKYIKDGKVTDKGKHNHDFLANGEKTPRGNYPEAMKKACEKHNAIYVDMTSLSAELVEKYAEQDKTSLFYISSDSTHERTLGALELANAVTKDLKKQGYFADYIKDAEPRIILGKQNISFGSAYPDSEIIEEFDISIFNVKSGNIQIKAPKGFEVSLSKNEGYSSLLKIDCSKLDYGTKIFVKFTPKKVAAYKGNLGISHDSLKIDFGNISSSVVAKKSQKIALEGNGKEKITGGENVKITWPLIDSENKYTSKPDSNDKIAVSDANVVGLDVLSPQREFDPSDEGDYVALYSVPGGVWPVNDAGAKNDNMYIEFAIPANGKKVVVNKISFFGGSYGSKNMLCHAYYSTDKKFKNPTQFIKGGKCSRNDLTEEFSSAGGLGILLKGKETLYIRIYPAYKDTKENTDKAFMMSNFVVNGLIAK